MASEYLPEPVSFTKKLLHSESLQENLRTPGAVPHKKSRRKRFVYGEEVNDAYDWVTVAKITGRWHLESNKEHKRLKNMWRHEGKGESDRRHEGEAAASTAADRRILSAHIGC